MRKVKRVSIRIYLLGFLCLIYCNNFILMSKTLTGKPISNDIKPTWAYVLQREAGKFKILVITDLHFSLFDVFTFKQTIMDISKMIKKFTPEILIITGDSWNNNPDGQGQKILEKMCKEFGKLGIPWAFVWGNHDLVDDYDKAHLTLENAPNSLYRGSKTDGNYRIELRKDENSFPIWNFIIINNSRGGMQEEQIDWFNNEVERIKIEAPNFPSAFIFMHIPLKEYDDVVNEKVAVGIKFEKNCPEESLEGALKFFSKSKMIKAMFCGHDHLNDYYGIKDGVRLQYIRSSGYGGYGGDKVRKGGTLITLDTQSGTFDTITVFPDGSTWVPSGFIDTPEKGKIY